jgi:dTDP-4-dehydrorhamnose 3,5-epimerase
MIEPTKIPGNYRIRPEVYTDDRGEFWRTYCSEELSGNGIDFAVCQSNVSVNPHKYTLRGFHYQRRPSTEKKILTVLTGALQAVIVDIRPDSPAFLSHTEFIWEAGDRSSLLIADGCATGFLTLAAETIVHYQMSDHFQPEYYGGFRYDDPLIGVKWYHEPAIVSRRDLGFVDLDPLAL